MTYKSAAEAREEAVRVLGDDLGQLYHHLKQDTYALLLDWRIYKGLFGTNEERVRLLNSASGLLAHSIDRALWERVLLRLCRLNDPPKQRENRNITIRALPPLIEEPLRGEIAELVEDARVACEPVRELRNKRLAHSDLGEREAQGISGASRRDIGGAIDSIGAVLQWVARVKMNVQLELDVLVSPADDEVTFLQVVHDGITARDFRECEILEARRKGDLAALKRLEADYPNWLKR